MKQPRGFTLLEILLVLVLLSISAVAVIATFPSTQKDEAKVAAHSVFQRLQLLNEDAILSGRDYGLRIDEKKGSIKFLHLTAEGWEPLDKRQISAELSIDSQLVLEFQLGGNVWLKDERLFEPGSLFDEQMFAENKIETSPQVYVLSSGEVTPFIIRIYPHQDSAENSWQVVVKENGEITLLAPGEQNEEA